MRAWALAAGLLLFAAASQAHDGHRHPSSPPAGTASSVSGAGAATPPSAPDPFPIAVGTDFALVDAAGKRRNRASFAGRHVLLFFGYANCDSICSATIPLMLAARDALGTAAPKVDTVMVTVDPARDTPDGLRRGLAKFGGEIIGLTGTTAELQRVWRGFHVNVSPVGTDAAGAPIYAHGSFVYLLGPQGQVLAMLPPVLAPDAMAQIVRGHLR